MEDMVVLTVVGAFICFFVLWLTTRKKREYYETTRTSKRSYTNRKATNYSKPTTVGRLVPRNPRTYRNASQNQLYIDGIPIYRYGSGENWTIARKPVTENDFVDWIRLNIKKQRFPTPEDRQKYYHNYIQWYYDSNDFSKNVYGGLKFTEGMIELSAHLSNDEKETIGQIFNELLKSDPRSYRFQQELFDRDIKVDPLFFSKVALAASFQVEQDWMADYYHEYDFDTEAKVYEVFNNSQYLKKYPRLREKVIKDALMNKIHLNTGDDYPHYEYTQNEEPPPESKKKYEKHIFPPFMDFGPAPGKENQKIYGQAFVQARKEFAEQGISHPTGKTPGFRDRIQDIYEELLNDSIHE